MPCASVARRGPERGGARIAGLVLGDDDDLAGGAAAQQVDRERRGVAVGGLRSLDRREHEVARVEDARRLLLELAKLAVDGIWPRALITAACIVPRPVVSWPAGLTPPARPVASWPAPVVS